jgi:hypothetical protein
MEREAASRLDDSRGQFEEPEPEHAGLSASELGVAQQPPAQLLHEYVGDRGEQDAEGVAVPGRAGRG